MRRARQASQLLALYLFVVLAWAGVLPLLLRLDPLAALALGLSPERSQALLLEFWPALALAALTLLLGRFFCGWLCPLGTCVDLADRALTRARRRRRANQFPTWPRWALLGLSLGAALFGTHLFWLADPLCLFTRTAVTVAHPVVGTTANGLLRAADPLLLALAWRAAPLPFEPFRLNLLVGVVFLALLALGVFGRRVWCRSFCPLGALLALLGRWGLWRRQVEEGCSGCLACRADCKLGAIPAEAPTRTRQSECVQCYDCVTACRPAVTRIRLTRSGTGHEPAVDLGRRQFLGLTALGATYGLLSVSGFARRVWQDRLLRPPGALVRDEHGEFLRLMTETEFRGRCLRCGQCFKACPTGGLQPAVTEAGLDGFYTPVLVPRAGWCEQNCNACGLACPSGALVPFAVTEKPRIQIGLATIDRDRCLAWREGGEFRQCLVCDEHCSYNAIETRESGGQPRPFVIDHKCVGCGICEAACPVKPEAAILVTRRGTPDEL